LRDVRAGSLDDAQREARLAAQQRNGLVAAAAVAGNHLVGQAGLPGDRVQQGGQAGRLVEHGEDQ
jgi:hypothetical protein